MQHPKPEFSILAKPGQWSDHITDYHKLHEFRFTSESDWDRCVELMPNVPALYGAPTLPLGGNELLVPAEAAPLLEAALLQAAIPFTQTCVRTHAADPGAIHVRRSGQHWSIT